MKSYFFYTDQLTVGYDGKPLIKEINIQLNKGEILTLIGPNGAGKTTLIKLITRLYDPTEGQILLDGKDIREYDLKDLYSLYGIIFQDFGKYAVTVKENVWFSKINEPLDEKGVEDAAKMSSASDFIAKLPNGFNTPLMRYFEENGTRIVFQGVKGEEEDPYEEIVGMFCYNY